MTDSRSDKAALTPEQIAEMLGAAIRCEPPETDAPDEAAIRADALQRECERIAEAFGVPPRQVVFDEVMPWLIQAQASGLLDARREPPDAGPRAGAEEGRDV